MFNLSQSLKDIRLEGRLRWNLTVAVVMLTLGRQDGMSDYPRHTTSFPRYLGVVLLFVLISKHCQFLITSQVAEHSGCSSSSYVLTV